MDYTTIRGNLTGPNSSVSVNHRALITRTLTKYPVDYALFRELIQNSADANAKEVQICFGSSDTVTTNNLRTIELNRLTVKNNGFVFREEDWSRLAEIAKGNPDESKIGAFGVGFYSVFEVTDEPLVHSGDTLVAFYYEGDQLMFKKQKVAHTDWTVVDLPYSKTGLLLPDLKLFSQFLTQSFMLLPLESLILKINDLELLRLTKTKAEDVSLSAPRNLNYRSPNGYLTLASIMTSRNDVKVQFLNATQMESGLKAGLLSFGKKLMSLSLSSEDPSDTTEITCHFSKVTATVAVSVPASFARKMKETVMKPPPKVTSIVMLTRSVDEKNASDSDQKMLQYIFPEDTNDAKIFIGFPTKQSTGMLTHMALNQVIPTMERTAIDMSNAHVKDWNEQLLYMAGVISRVLYETELSEIYEKESSSRGDKLLQDACKYLLKKFCFHNSTPDVNVGRWIASGFWSCSPSILLPSTSGALRSDRVRVAGKANFVKDVPTIPEYLQDYELIKTGLKLNVIKEIGENDVLLEVRSRTLTAVEFKALLYWLADRTVSRETQQILRETKLKDTGESDIISVSTITHYEPKGGLGKPELKLPAFCLPLKYSSEAPISFLNVMNIKELDWITYLHWAITSKLPSAEWDLILQSLDAIFYFSLIDEERKEIADMLKNTDCISTQQGYVTPGEAYVVKISFFPDLPVAKDIVSRRLLLALGVRESIDMALVMNLMSKDELKWSTNDVVGYLTENQSKLKSSDWDLLRTGKFFEDAKGTRRALHEMYAPDVMLEGLNFPVLQWNLWHRSSSEASLLHGLGLKKFPTESEIFSKGGSNALRYYLDHYKDNGYSYSAIRNTLLKIVPCTDKTSRTPLGCYSDPQAELFGFAIVEPWLREESWKLGVPKEPNLRKVCQHVVSNPPSVKEADKVFEYLAARVSKLSKEDVAFFSNKAFIPKTISDGSSTFTKYFTPEKVFLAKSSLSLNFYENFFDFVNFSSVSNGFLVAVGVRFRPDIEQVAEAAVDNPQELLAIAGNYTRYEALLQTLFDNIERIATKKPSVIIKMKRSSFLVGNKISVGEDEKESVKYALVKAADMCIVDNVIDYDTFKTQIWTCPQNETLEALCRYLGTVNISSLVKVSIKVSASLGPNEKLSAHIRERCKLFADSTPMKRKMNSSDIAKIACETVQYIQYQKQIVLPGGGSTSWINVHTTATFDAKRRVLYTVANVDWFDVAVALVPAILSRPNADSAIVLETHLSENLKSLQRKGYNVKRLLREEEMRIEEKRRKDELIKTQQAEEAAEKERQLAEQFKVDRERRRRLEETRAAQAEQNNVLEKKDQKAIEDHAPVSQMSNSGDSASLVPATSSKSGKKLFNWLTGNSGSSMRSERGGGGSAPGSTSGSTVGNALGQAFGNALGGAGMTGGGAGNGPLIKPGIGADQTSILRQGINKSQSFSGNNMNAAINGSTEAPEVQQDCGGQQAQDLARMSSTPQGVPIFVSANVGITQQHLVSAQQFAKILLKLGDIFGLAHESIHIFVNPTSTAEAFNSNGALFFNLSYFDRFRQGSGQTVAMSAEQERDAYNMWYPIMAHELAHNLFGPHGQSHSFYTETYIQYYMNAFRRT